MGDNVFQLLTVTAGAMASVWFLCYPVRSLLERAHIVDHPNERSSHSRPTARGGGAVIMLVLLAAGCACVRLGPSSVGPTVLTVAGFLSIISFVDDLRSLPAWLRFGCHALAAVAALAALKMSNEGFFVDASGPPGFAAAEVSLLGFLWIVGYTNAFNFMDGINGIAAGQAIVTGFGMALLGGLATRHWAGPVLWSAGLGGAALGFLPHNFPQARMFMGDVGSAPLGFGLAALVLWLSATAGAWLLVPLALLHANFVLDTGLTLVRRILRGECWYAPHREFFFHRLIRSGKSHPFVTSLEMALQTVVLGLMVIYLYAGPAVRVGLGALVILLWLAFFAYCERSFGKSNKVSQAEKGPTQPEVREHA